MTRHTASKRPMDVLSGSRTAPPKRRPYYSFALNREVVLLSDSVETPRITVRMVKLDPEAWPVTPPPEETARAPTLPYDNVVVAAPLPVDPPPPPAQVQKKSKKRRREFHMCA